MNQWSLAKLQAVLTPPEIIHFFHVYIVLGGSGGVISKVESNKLLSKHTATINKYNNNIASLNLWKITRNIKNSKGKILNHVSFLLKENELTDLISELFEIGKFLELSYIKHNTQFNCNQIFKLFKDYQLRTTGDNS